MARAGTCESKKNKKKFDPVRPRPKRVVLTLNLHSATHVRLRLYSADCTQHSTMSCPSHIQHLSPSCVALFSNLCKMDMRRLLEKKCRKSFDPIQSLLSPSPLFVFIFFPEMVPCSAQCTLYRRMDVPVADAMHSRFGRCLGPYH